MDKLSALRAFVHIAQTGSFTAAAAQMSTVPSAVTRKISALEQTLGTRLLNRTTHGVALTDEGAMCLEHGLRIMEEMDAIEQHLAVRRSDVSGQLRVSAPYAMGQVYLLPNLHRFFDSFPGVTLHVHYSDETPDLIEQQLDLAIRVGLPKDARLVAKRLARSQRVTCVAPAYLARHGAPASVEDLRTHACVVLLRNGRRREWRFAVGERERSLVPAARLIVNSGVALREAALAGLGVVQCNSALVAPELRSGALLPVMQDMAVASDGLYVVYPRNRNAVPRVKEFVSFLGTAFAD